MVLAAAGLVVLLPFMIVVALLIRLTSPGPAIFRQVRCGLNGRRFLFYKFRSMCADAEQMKAGVDASEHPQDGHQDPGRSAADARGPLSAQILDRRVAAAVERAERRHVAGGSAARGAGRSGAVSDLAAPPAAHASRADLPVGGLRPRQRGFRDLDELDMQYIDNWSLALDWKIILRTIPRVLTRHGAN